MQRREFVAGVGSVGALAGAGGLLWRGLPSFGDGAPAPSGDEDGDPLEVETVDARGSTAGTFDVRGGDEGAEATAVMFFTTGCGQCQAQIPRLAEARQRLATRHGDAVRFLSVTYQSPERLPSETLREWWTDHSGEWAVGYEDGLAAAYGVVGFPVTIVVDSEGEKGWEENGVLSPRRVVGGVESVLE